MSKKPIKLTDEIVKGIPIRLDYSETRKEVKKELLALFGYHPSTNRLKGLASYDIQKSRNSKTAVDNLLQKLNSKEKVEFYQVIDALEGIAVSAEKDSYWSKNALAEFTRNY